MSISTCFDFGFLVWFGMSYHVAIATVVVGEKVRERSRSAAASGSLSRQWHTWHFHMISQVHWPRQRAHWRAGSYTSTKSWAACRYKKPTPLITHAKDDDDTTCDLLSSTWGAAQSIDSVESWPFEWQLEFNIVHHLASMCVRNIVLTIANDGNRVDWPPTSISMILPHHCAHITYNIVKKWYGSEQVKFPTSWRYR